MDADLFFHIMFTAAHRVTFATARCEISAISRLHLGYISATSRLYLDYISAVSRLHLDCISAASRLHLRCISAISRLYLGCISVGRFEGAEPGERGEVRHVRE